MTKKEKFNHIAMELIYRKGFSKMTMRDLAEAMGCDVSNIYNYTSSKNALLETHLFDISKKFHAKIDEILASHIAPEVKIQKVISLHILLASEQPYTVALLNNEYRSLMPEKLEEFITTRTSYERKIQTIIEQGIKNTVFKLSSPKVSTSIVLASLRWIYTEFAKEKNSINTVDLENEITNFIMGGLLA